MRELLLKIKTELKQMNNDKEITPSGYGDIEYRKCTGCTICKDLLPSIEKELLK